MNIFGSLLFLHGHVTNAELARQLASPSAAPPRHAPQPSVPAPRARSR
ncbi:hypothetical protein [Stenotrophomonas pavanii]|nr:hypothetical protein [Stenotrophomonas pavanii]SDK63379.1 hypothetical protein SAMN04487784_2812 [Stenotrophomonas pavanii]